jgi:hypothetical protein
VYVVVIVRSIAGYPSLAADDMGMKKRESNTALTLIGLAMNEERQCHGADG